MGARPSGRAADELRAVRFTRQYTSHAEGSVLVEFGGTRVPDRSFSATQDSFKAVEVVW